MKLEVLYTIIKGRIRNLPADSYIASLCKKGEDKIIQKVGEEAVEVILAAKNNNRQRIIEEMADLYFMTLVLLAVKGITLASVFNELEKRKNIPKKQIT